MISNFEIKNNEYNPFLGIFNKTSCFYFFKILSQKAGLVSGEETLPANFVIDFVSCFHEHRISNIESRISNFK